MPYLNEGKKCVFVFDYESSNNMFKGKKLIDAPSLGVAQTEFFEWLKTQEVYPHLWGLNFNVELVEA